MFISDNTVVYDVIVKWPMIDIYNILVDKTALTRSNKTKVIIFLLSDLHSPVETVLKKGNRK